MELSQILTLLQSLSAEDKQTVMGALTEQPQQTQTQTAPESETAQPVAQAEAALDAENVAQGDEDGDGEEQSDEDDTQALDGGEGAKTAEGETGSLTPSDAELPAQEQIPDMAKLGLDDSNAQAQAQADAAPVVDEQGEDLPIDYAQIIDGQNAKILALEAENKQLKAKTEGAFGLTSKPGGFASVNPLYGDTSDIPRMRR